MKRSWRPAGGIPEREWRLASLILVSVFGAWNHGRRLDLDLGLLFEQGVDHYQGHGGVVAAEDGSVGDSDGWPGGEVLGSIGHVPGEASEVAGFGAGGLQHGG